MTPSLAELTYTIPEAGTALGVSHDTIERLIDRGLPCLRIGTRRLIVKTALIRWADEHANSWLELKGTP